MIKSGAVRLTFQIAPGHKFAAYLDRIVKFRGHECPAAVRRGGLRHPQPQALLHGAGEVHRRRSAASCSSKPAGRRTTRPIRPTKSSRASGRPTSAGPIGRRPSAGAPSSARTTSACRTATRTRRRCPMSPGRTHVKGGMQLGQRRQPPPARDQRRHRPLPGVPDGRRRAAAGVGRGPQHAAMGGRATSSTTWASTSRTRWTYKRLTLNPGIRFEAFNTYVPTQGSPAGRFVPFREFDEIQNLPNWRDVAPRLGVVYDVFDDGRTAHQGPRRQVHACVLHRRLRRGLQPDGHRRRDRRTWTDLNGDDIAQDIEIGPVVTPFNVSGTSNRTARSRYQAALPVGVQPGHSARAGHGRLPVVQLGAARLQPPVLDRQRPRLARATTPSST